MLAEYRIILTATFVSAAERDAAYSDLKAKFLDFVQAGGKLKRADGTKDDYFIPEAVTEKIA